MEKKNDVSRQHYFSSNHKDAPRDIIITNRRIEELSEKKRKKRKYHKVNHEYWEIGIRDKRNRPII